MRPKISVVIPVYNGEKFIRRAINSVLLQSYPAHELIVVDDGSTDGTMEILKSYGDKIIRCRIPNSGGPSKPRNTAIRIATGDYIALLDADDIWLRRRLEADAEMIQRFPDVGFICSNFMVRKNNTLGGPLIRHYDAIPNKKDFNFDAPLKKDPLKLLLVNNFVGTPTAVTAKRSAMMEAGLFNEDCRMVEDLEFFLRMARREKFIIISEPLFYKRAHGESMSANELRLQKGHIDVLQEAYKKKVIVEKKMVRRAQRTASEMQYRIGHTYFEMGKHKEAFATYGEAWKTYGPAKGVLSFLWVVSRKTIRIFSGGLISRRNLDRFADRIIMRFFGRTR